MSELERQIRRMIGWDIEAGVLPEQVRSWNDLKAHVNPDDYFKLAIDHPALDPDRDAIRASLDAWLTAGRPKED